MEAAVGMNLAEDEYAFGRVSERCRRSGDLRREAMTMRRILDIPLADVMSAPIVTVTPETSIDDLTKLMNTYEYNAFPVVNDVGVLQGLVTRLDLFKLYLLPYRSFIPSLEDTWVSSVGAIMTRDVITLYSVELAMRAMALMVEYRIHTIPIITDTTAGKTLVGVVTRRDLAAALNP
jgi:tRNA nucleotidyltransferase (CCA-adding enzyme)